MIHGRGGSAPVWTVGIAIFTAGMAFGSIGVLPLLLGWRFDFDRRDGSVTVWNWFQKHELPLSMIEQVESQLHEERVEITDREGYGTGCYETVRYRLINLRIRDDLSRLHIMCDNVDGNAADTLRRFLSGDR